MHESDSLMIANQIQGLRTEVPGGLAMSFGDIRVARRADWMIERVAAMGTVVLRQLGETRAGERRVCRFLSSLYVSVDRIVRPLGARTAAQCAGRRILAVQDTTEINFAGREKKRRGFGPAGNGKTPGFFIHPVIAVDVETEAVVGLVDAAIWTRSKARTGPRRGRSFEDKESARWRSGCEAAAQSLFEAASVTMVADRESDIYALFSSKPAGLDLIVRAGQDRKLAAGGRLFEALGGARALVTGEVRVPPRGPGDGSRRPASDVIADEFAAGLERISQKLEGKTARQKNPHPPGSLAFVAWIAARLGGWNCYYKPPGPKTMRTGWNRLAAILEGYVLATQGKDP